MCFFMFIIWAAPSEFVSSSIPSWQTLTAHAQPFRGARDLAFCLKVPLDSLLVWASSEGSGETARMRRLAWTFAARIGDKYQIRLARPILHIYFILLCFCSCNASFFSFLLVQENMCRNMRKKQQNVMFSQWRLRSACVSSQSNQSLRYPHEELLGT